MLMNLRNLFPSYHGFIIKIENGYYGKNYEDEPLQEVSDGDIFLFSDNHNHSVLAEIECPSAKVLCQDQGSDQTTFNYIKSLRH